MISLIGYIVISIMAWLFIIMVHEYGHYLALKMRGAYTKIVYKNGTLSTQWLIKLRGKDTRLVHETGVLFGIVAIGLVSIIHWVYWLYLFPYIIGCREDIKEMINHD